MGGSDDVLDKEQKRKALKKEKKHKKRKREESETADQPLKKRKTEKTEKKEKKEKKSKKEKRDKKDKKDKKEEKVETGGEGKTVHLYRQHGDVRNASRKTVDAYRKEKDIFLSIAKEMDEESELAASKELTADPLWNPITAFGQAKDSFGEVLLNAACGTFDTPSPIQAQSWPVLLSGRDAVAIAATGSGKTLSFLLPALRHVMANGGSKNRNARVLVLAPTRELAIQSFEVSKVAGKAVGLHSACIYGGVAKYEQRQLLKRGVQLIIATPGRLLDLVEERNCDLSHVDYVILDEGDRMLDMGFEPDVTRILGLTKSRLQRQTVMFSATWPQVVQQLASKFLKADAIKICIARDGNSNDMDQPQANRSITQHVELIEDHEKEQRLITLLRKYHKNNNRVLVFCLYKKEAARVHRLLQRRGFPKSCAIHGDMNQHARSEALSCFKDASHPILVATDVAARGLDIPDVEYVLNYTFPLTIEDYVHRIGRTGRGGKTGTSHTLFTRGEKKLAGDLSVVLKDAGQHVPPEIEAFGPTIKRKKEHAMYGAHFRDDNRPMKAATRVVFDD